MSNDITKTHAAIGSWQWLTETSGVLTARERLGLLPALGKTFGQFAADRFRLAFRARPIGFYLQAGAMADLAGLRAWQLPADFRARALQTFPREEIHRVVSSCWHAEAKAVPGGRAHFADTWGGFSRIVRWFPVSR